MHFYSWNLMFRRTNISIKDIIIVIGFFSYSSHLPKIGILAIHHLILHDWFIKIVFSRDKTQYLRCSNVTTVCNLLQFVRIVTDRISEGLTLHDLVPTLASWGAIAGGRKLKIVKCESCLSLLRLLTSIYFTVLYHIASRAANN